MLKKEMYESLVNTKEEINLYLQRNDMEALKQLMLFLANSESYLKLKEYDNQLFMLDQFCFIWRNEKNKLLEQGVLEDIFWNVNSLDDVQYKYNLIKYAAFRIENSFPLELCESAINELIAYKISGIAIGVVIINETKNKNTNMIRISEMLEKKNRQDKAVMLLEYGISKEIFS